MRSYDTEAASKSTCIMSTPATPSRTSDGDNAEAGPSTPRSYRTAPETPTRSGSIRRRSWFGLGGFASLTTPTKESSDTPRRSSFVAGMILADRGSPVTRPGLDDDTKEELTIDAHPAGSPRKSKRRSGTVDGDEGEVMVLQNLTRRSESMDGDRGSRMSGENSSHAGVSLCGITSLMTGISRSYHTAPQPRFRTTR
jgi:hypothetical protein